MRTQPTSRNHAARARARRVGLVIAAVWALGSTAAAEAADRYVVVLKGSQVSTRDVARQHDRHTGVHVERVFGAALKGYSATLSTGRAARLRKDPRVAFVTRDRPVHAAGPSTAQTVPTGVDRIEADLSSARSGDGTGAVTGAGVAVLDTGSGPHPDLNVAGGKACVGSTYDDGNGHGTHAAGTIGARDDGAGVVGVAPGAPIWSVRVLDSSGGGSTSSLLCGIDWVTANAQALGIRVASLSLSTPGADDRDCGNTNDDPIHLAICGSVAQGVTYVAAAGNDARDFAGEVPAAYDEVLTVTAVSDTNGRPGGGGSMPKVCSPDADDTAADFSNFTAPGSPDVAHTIAAPGKCINSTWRDRGYRLESGTSMATPHVSGAAALCIAIGPCAGLSPAGVIGKLMSTAAAQPVTYGFTEDPHAPMPVDRHYGYLVNAGVLGSGSGPGTGPGPGTKPPKKP